MTDGPPNVGHLIIRTKKDIENLIVDESLLDTEAFLEQIKTIEILKREKGEHYPVLSAVIGSFSMPPILMGMDKWLDLLLTGSDETRTLLLKKCSDFCIMKIKALFKAGVDIISYSNPVATSSFINVKQFESLALPWVQRDINTVGPAGIVYFNGGGLLNPMIDSIINHTGVGTIYIHPMDDIKQAKNIINGRALIAAPINDIPLIQWSPDKIGQEVKRIIMEGKEGGGFIFGTLAMPLAIPSEKIKIMMEAAVHHGAY